MYSEIKKDKQIIKFCFYGFFKNLRFFEPYLLIYLISLGYNLFTIGSLFALREIIVYIFEVPSGIIADYYGKKKELLLCFVFYIVSFVCFFIGTATFIFLAMVFYGLGEAFRSGTHKAMIISYLEKKGWDKEKTFVYGRTRSFSLLGSAISSLLSILFIINFSNMRFIFLLAVIPYILDFLLILSYPSYLDEPSTDKIDFSSFKELGLSHLKSLKEKKKLKKVMLSSAVYDSIFKTIKDYVQPILIALLITNGLFSISGLDENETSKVVLGIMYFLFYICSSQVSKNLYKLTKKISPDFLYNVSFLINSFVSIMLIISIHFASVIGITISFLIFYILKDGRRPLFVELSSRYMSKNERATMLSVESQFKALFMIILAPLFGYFADSFSIQSLFMLLVFVYAISYFIFKEKHPEQ